MKFPLHLAVVVTSFLTISFVSCQLDSPPECSPCAIRCQFGLEYIYDNNNECSRCVCSPNPCDKKKCPGNSVCQVKINDSCPEGNCGFSAICSPKVKTGECPISNSITNVDQEECQDDLGCPGDYKCCSSASNRKACIKPCHFSKCHCSNKMDAKLVVSTRGCHSCLCMEKKLETRSICSMPKEIGPCKSIKKRYYYDNQEKMCKQFSYGGCGGNSNKFFSRELCEHSCGNGGFLWTSQGNRDVGVEDQVSNKSICQLEKAVGPCKAAMPRFFFNMTSHRCEQFIYGGCLGNKNNFGSVDECENSCGYFIDRQQERKLTDSCHLLSEIGPCKASLPRYFFNHLKQKCELFFYGMT